jgi:hypothetical protein
MKGGHYGGFPTWEIVVGLSISVLVLGITYLAYLFSTTLN